MKTDTQLQQDVMDELQWDPRFNASEIGVAVKNGIVTLSGHVDNYTKKLAAEEAEKQFLSILKRFKWSLVIEKYAREFNVTVERQDYINFAKARILNYMQSNGLSGSDNEWLNNIAENSLKDKKFIEETYPEIRSTKVFEKLDKQVIAKEEEIDFEDFKKLLHHHHH